MRILLTILTAFLLFSCTTQRKAVNYFNANEDVAAAYCAVKFPPKDSIVTHIDTVLKASNPDYTKVIDSLNNALGAISEGATADSLLASTDLKACQLVVQKQSQTIKRLRRLVADIKGEYQPCKPDTILKQVDRYISNTAKEKVLELQLQASQKETDRYKGKYGFWLKAAIAGWLLFILLLALIVFRSRIPFKLW